MSSAGVPSVDEYTRTFQKLLSSAREAKSEGSIEPPLTTQDLGDDIRVVRQLSQHGGSRNYAAIETAFRNIFYNLIASISIKDPAFSEIWNLLDIVSTLSDLELCEPGLVFWLVEELLDSQTIEGCRIVFDYLDSRRERLTARDFKKKQLIILRACNELLRRLSRAEDIVFCGRVFIFLFQSFPLGDRSSVNLRGEYHVENATAFEDISPKKEPDQNGMQLDREDSSILEKGTPLAGSNEETQDQTTKAVNVDPALEESQKPEEILPNMDTLYSMFWSLQEYFSQPTKLFDDQNLRAFKGGLQVTMQKFRQVHQELQARGTSKLVDDNKRGIKRKRTGQEDNLSSSFNPKYLTSRDLFELEISDLAFRRHILVQALILVDFLILLSPKAKKKLEHTSNKSVLYSYVLSEENAKWATGMRNDIALYLQQGPEGKFYYRMVDTVLSRDKNWVHWKAENCPPIARDPIAADDFAEAEKAAQKACANKRLRSTPMGTLDLKFLSDASEVDGIERLKRSERYTIPTVESFKGLIAEDQSNIEMARTDEEKRLALDAKASKMWRTLRIASKSRFTQLQSLFDPELDESKETVEVNGTERDSGQSAREEETQKKLAGHHESEVPHENVIK